MYDGSGPGNVPDRWLNCPRKASNLVVNKFLAFKTPLSSDYDSQVPAGCRFTPTMLFQLTKSYQWRIGLWVDLTNTTRFYKRDEVNHGYGLEKEVAYTKIQCRGHGEAPSVDQTKLFIKMCKHFIAQHPLEIIGVHCTHGFNRTGFLIVSYLVSEMDFSVDAALREFARCRPPGIYKGDYIRELFRRFEDEDDAPEPPLRPTWCFVTEPEEIPSDDGEDNEPVQSARPGKRKGANHSQKSRKRGRMAKNPVFMEGVPGVTPVYEQSKVDDLFKKARAMCGATFNGFPGCQPVSMDTKNISLLSKSPYQVSWKADGTRYMLMVLGENEVYFLDRDNCAFLVTGLKFVCRKDLNQHMTDSLMDGEMVIDKHEGKDIPRYLIYDIIMVNGIDVHNKRFAPERLLTIEADVIKPRVQAIRAGKIDRLSEPFSVRAKSFMEIEKAGAFLSEKFSRQLSHEPDGLIFQPAHQGYTPGQCPDVLKWKPPSLNSIDFILRIGKESGMGVLERKVGNLFVGGHDLPVGIMKLFKGVEMYDNKIVECSFKDNKWIFMRERTDKSYPNSYNTAVSVMESIKNPITKENLLDYIKHNRYVHDRELMPPPKPRMNR